MRRPFALCLLLGIATAVRGVELHIVPRPNVTDPAAAATAKFTLRPLHVVPKAPAPPPLPVEALLPLDKGGTVDVAEGEWSLDVESDDWWHARQYLHVSAERADVVVPLLRSGFITGAASLADGSVPKDVQVRFTAEGLNGETNCPIVDKRFRCRVAAGLLDLRLRTKGCIAHYKWGTKIAAGATVDAGALTFERGAAITGSVLLGRGVRESLERLRVRAAPEGAAASRLQQYVATPGPRGFFHLDGVPPGQYTLTAEGPYRISSSPVTVTVIGDGEVQLRDPIVADIPRSLTVDVLPLLDPDQKPWIITLEREISQNSYVTTTQGSVDDRGTWSAHVQPGHYTVRVSSLNGAKWDARDVDLDTDAHVVIPLTTRELHGTALLGRKPLSATLLFGGEYGSQILPAQSDQEGHFRVRLPRPDVREWDVTVDAEAPRVKRTVKVKLPENGDDDVVLQLRDTVIFGTVVDESGKAVGRDVVVNMTAKGEVMQVAAGEGGAFAFHGVDPGPYTLQAEGFLLQSDALPIAVPEDGATDEVRLVVKPVRKVVGHVLANGGPVAGARVNVVPADVPFLSASYRDTDERGEFATTVPWNCHRIDVFVAAPGFAYKAFRTTLREQSMLNIPVDQRGGMLTARWPKAAGRAVLLHAGAMIWPDALVGEWGGRRRTQNDVEEVTSGPLDPGVYTLCPAATTGVGCVDTYLPPFGDVVLEHPM